MLKTCDECGKRFDESKEGLWGVVCGTCLVESSKRIDDELKLKKRPK